MTKKERLFSYLKQIFKEASTYRGLVLIATACGVYVSPEQIEAITAGGLFIAGMIGAVFPDKKIEEKE